MNTETATAEVKKPRIPEFKMISEINDGAQISGMVKALKLCGTFAIEKTPTTLIVTFRGVEVLRSLKGNGGIWITRRADNLFN